MHLPITLQELKKHTILVVDSGDLSQFQKYPVRDATTNPSLILQAAEKEIYRPLIQKALHPFTKQAPYSETEKGKIMDAVLVGFGLEILKTIPGRVSTEVDARLSFDVEGSLKKARTLVSLYENAGISRERLLIKLASTWEGFETAKILEKEGIHCNMTLLFCLPQAICAAQVGATLISPFVGRILDWYKKNKGFAGPASEDPGVLSVKKTYEVLKRSGSMVEIMGASFRSVDEILELAGCDLLTISPSLFDELEKMDRPVERKLIPPKGPIVPLPHLDEKTFRFLFNEDEMAVDKLGDGIRKFTADTLKLEELIMRFF